MRIHLLAAAASFGLGLGISAATAQTPSIEAVPEDADQPANAAAPTRTPAPAPVRVNAGLAAPAAPATSPDGFFWKSGKPLVTLADGNFTLQPVARFDFDFGHWFGQSAYPGGKPIEFGDSNNRGVPTNPLNVRRARAGVQGTYLKDFTYNFTWEFAPGPGKQFDLEKNSKLFELQTAWNGLGWGTVRVGAYTILHTLEFAGSSFESLMLERPAIINMATSLASGDTRSAVGLEARGDRWFAAGYGTAGVLGTIHTGNQRGLVGRAVVMAFNNPEFKLLIGGNGANQFHPGNSPAPTTISLRDYPEVRLDPNRLLSTGNIRAGAGYAYGPEISGMIGPVLYAAEYQWIYVDANAGQPNYTFGGYYANVAVPLLGGPRRYDKARGAWVRPKFEDANFAAGHYGFAEVVGRYSYATAQEGAIRGGRQSIWSLALNYYPTQRLRLSLQYNNGHVTPGAAGTFAGNERNFQIVAGRISFNW